MPITEENLDRIISASERRQIVPYSDMHIWRLERNNKFPKRVHLGPRRVGWSLNEIMEWINARKSER
jgi:prophage regulatory protein